MSDEHELDLRPLVLALLRNWYIPVIGAVIAVVVIAFWYGRLPAYQAEAQVAVIDTTVTANFESGITRDEPKTQQVSLAQTLTSLAESDSVIKLLIERSGEQLPAEQRQIARVRPMLSATLDPRSGLIQLSLTSANPDQAIALVNLWAQAFEDESNRIYGTGRSKPLLATLQQQYDSARQTYEQHEQVLSDFIARDQTPLLAQRGAEYQALVENMRMVRAQVISETARANLLQATTLISTYQELRWSGQTAVVSQELRSLQQSYQALLRLEGFRRDAQALRDHLRTGGDGASAGLAIALLKAQVFAASSELPATVQLQVGQASSASLADADSLLKVIEERSDVLRAEIGRRSEALRDNAVLGDLGINTVVPRGSDEDLRQLPTLLSNSLLLGLINGEAITDTSQAALLPDDALVQIQRRVQQIEAQVHTLKAQRSVLENERDAAEKTYVALGRQISEISSASTAGSQVARVASTAASAIAVGGTLSRAILVGATTFLLLALLVIVRELSRGWLRGSPRPTARDIAQPETRS